MKGRLVRIGAGVVVLALLVAGLVVALDGGAPQKQLTADFTSTVSLYPGANVEILGVAVGKVTSVTTQGTHVRVGISYDPKYKLPADVRASIVPPSIVGDRFVQLSPAYHSGPTLADDAALGTDRTAVPLELDDAYRGLDKMATALGPNGANADGALSRLITASAANLDGNGAAFHDAIEGLSQAVGALNNSSGDIAGTVTDFGKITGTLAADDPQVRQLISNLTTVSGELNGQRTDIHDANTELTTALDQVSKFVGDNRGPLTADIAGLGKITGTLASHQRDLAELMDLSPLGVTNLADSGAYENFDPTHPGNMVDQAKTTAVMSRSNTFDDIATQLGFTMTAVCGALPPAQQQQLSSLCTALRQSGGQLGTVLDKFLNPQPDGAGGGGLTVAAPARSLPGLMLGAGS